MTYQREVDPREIGVMGLTKQCVSGRHSDGVVWNFGIKSFFLSSLGEDVDRPTGHTGSVRFSRKQGVKNR